MTITKLWTFLYYTIILFYYVIWYVGYGYFYVIYDTFWNISKKFDFIVKQFLDNKCSITLETLENNKIWICRKHSHPFTIIYNFLSLVIKMILLELAFGLSAPAADKTEYFVHLSFSFTLQLINSISSDLQKFLKHFTSTKIISFFRIPLAWSGATWGLCFLIMYPYT